MLRAKPDESSLRDLLKCQTIWTTPAVKEGRFLLLENLLFQTFCRIRLWTPTSAFVDNNNSWLYHQKMSPGSPAQRSAPCSYQTIGRYLPLLQQDCVPGRARLQERAQRHVEAPIQRRLLALRADRDLPTLRTNA